MRASSVPFGGVSLGVKLVPGSMQASSVTRAALHSYLCQPWLTVDSQAVGALIFDRHPARARIIRSIRGDISDGCLTSLVRHVCHHPATTYTVCAYGRVRVTNG